VRALPTRSLRRCRQISATFSEQHEATRLIDAALREGPSHAYLFYGPAGVGKSDAALRFGRALLGTQREFHPDLYELDALGEMIRIDAIRELHRDLHMRPFEADRRVYLIHHAHLLGEDAADALLKDLEEPPEYAVIVLVADDLGPIPVTIRSRCQLVPFRRLSEASVRALVDARAPQLSDEQRVALARVAAGRLDRLERLLDPQSAERRDALIEQARAAYRAASFDPAAAASALLANAAARGNEARDLEATRIEALDLTAKEVDQRVKRAARGAEREELLAELEELAAWYRDLVAVAVGAESAAIHFDKLVELREDATVERLVGAEKAAEEVRETWRRLEEFNLAPQLALEALFGRIARELA
jgi:DNA polymerase-3 subunit delta'